MPGPRWEVAPLEDDLNVRNDDVGAVSRNVNAVINVVRKPGALHACGEAGKILLPLQNARLEAANLEWRSLAHEAALVTELGEEFRCPINAIGGEPSMAGLTRVRRNGTRQCRGIQR